MNTGIEYDHYGRMKYNPIFHAQNCKPWSKEDLDYLINWYDVIGPDEMSFALERTIVTVMSKVYSLRNIGIMKKPKSRRHFERT